MPRLEDVIQQIYGRKITQPIKTSDDVYWLLEEATALSEVELFYAIPLNAALMCVGPPFPLAFGRPDTVTIDTVIALRSVIGCGAARVIFAHNHPSGDPTPSPRDIQTTMNLNRAAAANHIEMLDHIILGKMKTYSMLDMEGRVQSEPPSLSKNLIGISILLGALR